MTNDMSKKLQMKMFFLAILYVAITVQAKADELECTENISTVLDVMKGKAESAPGLTDLQKKNINTLSEKFDARLAAVAAVGDSIAGRIEDLATPVQTEEVRQRIAELFVELKENGEKYDSIRNCSAQLHQIQDIMKSSKVAPP